MLHPPSAQLIFPEATTRKHRPLPFRPSQSHDRNSISSLGLSNTSADHSAQRTKASKHDDIVGARVLSEPEKISDHTSSNGIIISSCSYGSC